MPNCSRTWEARVSRFRSMETMQSIKIFASASESTWAFSAQSLNSWWTDAKPNEIRFPWQPCKRWAIHIWRAAHSCITRWLWSRKAVPELLSDLLKNPTKQRHGVWCTADMLQTLRIDSTLSCRRSWRFRNSGVTHAEGFESGLRAWELDVGEWERASGTALADAVKYTVTMNLVPIFWGTTCSWVHTPRVPQISFVAMVLLVPKLWSKSDRVSWQWSGCGWWQQDASRLSQERQGEGHRQTPTPERKSHEQHKQHEQYRRQHVQQLWQNWTLGERLLETRWRSLRQSHQ